MNFQGFIVILRLEFISFFCVMDDLEYESLLMEKVMVYFVVGVMVGVMEYCVMYFVDCVKV